MRRALRLAAAAVVLVAGIRVLDWLVAPVLPLLVTVLVLAAIGYRVIGRRSL